ncbi:MULTISPECIES: ATP-binding cassette domain-containing protein [Pacificibacter]|uniref:ATP-binding cassette domain-containing protein n=1 Tax=Pacificibacter TaxID=1042323 RepID=UPI001C095CC0|nr:MULTISPECIES: ATP-binding cassette domain-containing protein [Pacificibacter]MBU2934647.1 ATP-binding cassette domain-containing protein [Pacificibacter marinus]MDO6616492.1 ATP-binding cassette domain-containing protein [Pacificibacter sp. 1_MG-2023]
MSLDLTSLTLRSPSGELLFAPLTLSVPLGDVVTVMGPSGVGKSTLLDAIGGHLTHGFGCSGSIKLNGREISTIPAETRQVGVMFQDAHLFPHLSVGDNLAFGLPSHIKGRAMRRSTVEAALKQAGLAGRYDDDSAALSGGQRARAALMRTLLAEPEAVLLDEPFSKLDSSLRDEIRHFTFSHIAARGIPALMVTHDEADAHVTRGRCIALKKPESD